MTFNRMERNILKLSLIVFITFLLAGCMKDNEWVDQHLTKMRLPNGVFIVNEGNFMYGNATLSFYNQVDRKVQNDIFWKVNGLPLGDVGQSMIIHGNEGYIVMNNSGKIYVIDLSNGNYIGKITNLTSPRYIHFINEDKAYVTDLYAGKITIFNPKTKQITGSILTDGHLSTEQMVQVGDLVFVTCWSFDNSILVIDTKSDSIVSEILTGKQPAGIVSDNQDKIWVLCDGGWGKTGTANRTPVLQKIDPGSKNIELTLNLSPDAKPSKLAINGTGDTLLFINNGIWRMAANLNSLPDIPFVQSKNNLFYGLGIDPKTSEIYFSDAIDYSQMGIVYRYSAQGARIDSFKTGIIPGAFCFK
jgi:DNA-binding beta-propeller fold protein YncE